MVFLTYDKGVGDHPENKDVSLRVMNLHDADRHGAGEALRRAGHDQRVVVVARTASTWRS